MHIDWATLGVIAIVAAAAALAVVLLLACAMVGWSARTRPSADGLEGPAAPGTQVAVGTTVTALCVLAAGSIVGYGLYLIIA